MSTPDLPRLSKSRYTSFLDCSRLGYMRCYPWRFEPYCRPPSAALEARREVGHLVGDLARRCYPNGRLIGDDHLHTEQALESTRVAIEEGEATLFEAAFESQGILVRADILRRLADGSYELSEVKSSLDVRELHIADLAIQVHVAEAYGLRIARANLMHLRRDYVHPGGREYDPPQLFIAEDVTLRVRDYIQNHLSRDLAEIESWLKLPDPPFAHLGTDCDRCEYYRDYCRPRAPLYPVSELRRAAKAFGVLDSCGCTDLRELGPGDPAYSDLFMVLTGSSYAPFVFRLMNAVASGAIQVESELGERLRAVSYPIHFFDFETWNPALPVIGGTRPYEHIPFQWSDHRLSEDGTVDHACFLADQEPDPRRYVAETLLARLSDEATVFCYHLPFERTRLLELAAIFPDLTRALEGVASRLVDLKGLIYDYVYHPRFHGNFSLKAVLPALTTSESYQGLAISDGEAASLAYELMREMPAGVEREQLREDLVDYCATDTLGMVQIYQELLKITDLPKYG